MKNIPIVGKFLTIMALFGVFALGVAGYAGTRILSIDTSYSNLLSNDAAAAIALARANRTLQGARTAIAELTIARTDADTASSAKELEASRAVFAKFMDAAIAGTPQRSDLGAIKAEGLRILDTTCANTIALGNASRSDESAARAQKTFIDECQSSFRAITPKFSQIVEEVNKGANDKSDELTIDSYHTVTVTVGGIIAGLLIVLAIGFVAIRSWLVKPIRGIADTMQRLADGDLSVDVAGTDRKDEVGSMAKAVQVFKENGLRSRELEQEAVSIRNASEAERARVADLDRKRAEEMAEATSGLADGLKHLSNGDLNFRLGTPFASDFESLRGDFNAAVVQLSETLGAVAEATGAIDSGSREISQAAEDLSKRTEQQAASLEETAAALDQITTNVANSSKRAEEARHVAIEAKQSARQSGEVVSNAVDAMQRIEQSSSRISNIIGVIDEIAFQTNLLALNAGVEAARAGEAGKGFAVVAQEVRELAQRSAQAAKEIKELIRNSAGEVSNGVTLVRATGDALKAIEGHVVTINVQLDAIALSSREQSVGLSEVNIAVNQMDQVTQQNAAMVEQSTAASSSLASEAVRLRHLISQFQIGSAQGNSGNGLGKAARTQSKPTVVREQHRPVASPARRMVAQVVRAVSQQAAAKADNWEEF
ncbi:MULTISPECIES: methyl-accepting chemotaxis protein [unclassified Rhizobium]|uniref:methyl-accepting chemotaxis protein n=1 Tax=unclassified Rhizobium TaxID=2613769 RepID=UPI00116078C7|nr:MULTISPECIES: methyl-accepting chemotaxis protein [unclassified Rhizobium]TQX84148.1 methyl-accepting chemotaxis protein [Rhizobium sp. rho-13.1]TQY06873.1 methyl-accepting chemotaxis protein [Rhizobium sp. rho-1.1]